MGAPKKVLFLLEDLCYGGTQTQTLELASRLDRDKFSPAILTLTGRTDLDKKAEAAKIPLFHMGATRSVPPLFFLGLGKKIKAIKPDIIVPGTALPNIWGRIWGRLKRVPTIVGTCRGGGAPRRQHEKLLWRLCDGIICNSRALMRDMEERGVKPERLVYIPNGVDTERFQPAGKAAFSEEPLILSVARLAKDKDQKTLLAAFEIVSQSFPKARLRMVGEGPEGASLRKFAARELSGDALSRVEFAGPSADPASHCADADIFALSSIREALPNAILEAMSCGLPICATAVGEIPALLDGNGLVSRPEEPEALANNLLALLREPRMALQMGKAGRQKAEREYSFEAMVRRHQDYFAGLAQKAV